MRAEIRIPIGIDKVAEFKAAIFDRNPYFLFRKESQNNVLMDHKDLFRGRNLAIRIRSSLANYDQSPGAPKINQTIVDLTLKNIASDIDDKGVFMSNEECLEYKGELKDAVHFFEKMGLSKLSSYSLRREAWIWGSYAGFDREINKNGGIVPIKTDILICLDAINKMGHYIKIKADYRESIHKIIKDLGITEDKGYKPELDNYYSKLIN